MRSGQSVRAHNIVGNDFVDALAKEIARKDALPRAQIQMVCETAARLRDAAVRIGRATAYANRCPLVALSAADAC